MFIFRTIFVQFSLLIILCNGSAYGLLFLLKGYMNKKKNTMIGLMFSENQVIFLQVISSPTVIC